MAIVNPNALLKAVAFEQNKRKAESSLIEFMKQSWDIIEPGTPYVDGWHLHAIADHLQAVSQGKIRNLIINMPPRHCKSILVAVIWPVWTWINNPEFRWLFASYSGNLSMRDSLKCRRMIQSTWFQERWGNKFSLIGDQNTKTFYENDRYGYRFATSVGGTTTGMGGSAIVCLHPDTRVLTSRGPIRIQKLVDNALPVRVMGYDHQTNTTSWQKIIRYESAQGRRSLKLKTQHGQQVILTHDHPVYVEGKGYIPAEEVRIGDSIVQYMWERDTQEALTNCEDKDTHLQCGVCQGSEAKNRERSTVRGVRSTCEKNTKARGEEQERGVLLQSVFGQCSERGKEPPILQWLQNIGCVHMQSMWAGVPKGKGGGGKENILGMLRGLQNTIHENAPSKTNRVGGKELPRVREDHERPKHYNGDKKVLWQSVQWRGAQQVHQWGKQWAVRAWAKLRKVPSGVQACCRKYSRKGWQCLQVVWTKTRGAPCCAARTPHRLRQAQQYSGQLDYAMSSVPWADAWQSGKQGAVVRGVVEHIENVETPEKVYNVAIENTHNYFANGILLHNCDDPHSAMEAQSDVIREGVIEWWDQAMSTRLNNPKTGSKVIVMQRLHERDLTGHLLRVGGYEHLCLPAEWDGVVRKTSLGKYDPRTIKGELLWPELYDTKALAPIKAALGEYGTAGQLQQSPSPAGGGIIKVGNIKLWPAKEPIPPLQYVIQSYDTAFTEKTSWDPSACTVWGIVQRHGENVALMLDAWAEHLGYPDLRSRVISEYGDSYAGNPDDLGNPGRKTDLVLIEEKASGQSLIQDLRRANVPVRGYNPGRADKVSRAHMIAPIIDAGLVYVIESKKNKGKPVSWAKEVIDEMEKFPAGEHDDRVDCTTQALIYLKDSGFLTLEAVDEREEEYYEKPKSNPYTA